MSNIKQKASRNPELPSNSEQPTKKEANTIKPFVKGKKHSATHTHNNESNLNKGKLHVQRKSINLKNNFLT